MEVTQNIAVTADKQAAHEPAAELSEDAQEAAPSPDNERESIAQADQVDEMEEAEPKPFDAAAFKAKLMERIASMQLPENQDEADNFEENNNIEEGRIYEEHGKWTRITVGKMDEMKKFIEALQ